MIIAISGKIGSGKDTVGKIIQYLKSDTKNSLNHWLNFQAEKDRATWSNWQIKKFAYKLKQIVSLLTGISVEDLEKQEVKDRILGEEWIQYYKDKIWNELTSEQKANVTQPHHHTAYRTFEKWIPTVRWLLQTVGTEAMRNHVHENVWVNSLFADYGGTIKMSANISFWTKKIDDIHVVNGKTTKCGKALLGNNYIEVYKELDEELNLERKVCDKCCDYPNWIITDLRFPNELKAVEDKNGITIRVNRPIPENSVFGKIVSQHPSETALDDAKFKYTIDNNGSIEELIEKVKEILILEKII